MSFSTHFHHRRILDVDSRLHFISTTKGKRSTPLKQRKVVLIIKLNFLSPPTFSAICIQKRHNMEEK